MITFKTNTAQFQILANKLEKHRRSSFPVVIRQTLNSAAFDMKKYSIQKEYNKKGFDTRNKGFLKFATQATPAQGFDVKKMRSIAGIADRNIKATDSFEKHETGGTIKPSVIGTSDARVSSSWNKKLRTKNRLGKVGNFPTKRVAKGEKRIFVKAAAKIAKSGGGLIHYDKYISRIESFKRGDKFPVKMKMLYIKDPAFEYKSKKKHLIKDSADVSGSIMPKEFIRHAQNKLTFK